MAQNPGHFMSQQQQGMTSTNLQQILGQKGPGGLQSTNMSTSNQAPSQERTIVDDFEATYYGILAPLLAGTDNVNKLNFSQEKLRSSVELAVTEFTDQARRVEAYFIKKHATVAQQQPELILQEEIDELTEEIRRRDKTIRDHLEKVKQWTESVKGLQNSLNERPSTAPPPVNPTSQAQPGQVHQDGAQHQLNQRR